MQLQARMSENEVTQAFIADGWSVFTDEGFISLAGPFFYKATEFGLSFRFPTIQKHVNRNGVLQGGALMTFTDRALGFTARESTGTARTATVQLNTQFVSAVKIGETVETAPLVVRATNELVFMSATLAVGPRTVAVASGVWKRFKPVT